MIFLLAMRNLLRNKQNSTLLIMLIAFITLVFFLGNSLIDQSVSGMRRTYVDNLTGDLVVQKKTRVSMNLFGANTPIIDKFFKIPTLPAYEEVKKTVETDEGVLETAGMVSGMALMDIEGVRAQVPLIGVEVETYFDIFPGIVVEKGRKLLPGEEGVMLTSGKVKSIENKSGNNIHVGDAVLLTSAGNSGFKIREVPIVGIFSYTNPGPYMKEVVITDPQTVRALSSVLSVAAEHVDVSEDALELLDEDPDNLFGEGDFSSTDITSNDNGSDLLSSLKEDLVRGKEVEPVIGGDWNFLIIRLRKETSPSIVQNKLNTFLNDYNVRAVGWQTAAGNSALMVLLIQALFYGGILLVGIAGVITIVNIILISVFKRVREMGTLRAIGASDGYIMLLLFTENLFISLVGGAVGIGVGRGLLNYINSQAWTIPQDLIAALIGSPVLIIQYYTKLALQALLLAVLLGILSTLFPAWKATRISPIEAVRRG